MRVLIVGAGAVGQIYGKYLAHGGAQVSFLVRSKYADACRKGFVTWRVRLGRTPAPERWSDFEVLTADAEVAARTFDQVWLCMSTTAMQGPWFDGLVAAMGDAMLVTLQPGLEARAWLAQRVPAERTVCGMIGLVSYHAPLPGETVEQPGVAYWFPPLTPSPFSGPARLRDAVVDTLKRGGMPAAVVDDATAAAAVPTAIMMPHLAALEAAGWTFRGLLADPRLGLAASAAREGMAIAAHHHGAATPWWGWLVRPGLIRLLAWVGPRVTPFPLETYLAVHFTKVGDQTRYLLRSTIHVGQQVGLPVSASQDLLSSCFPAK